MLILAACDDVDGGLKVYTEPPQVAIESPTDGATLNEGVTVVMKGRVVDDAFESNLTSISPTWSVNGGAVCESAVVDSNGLTSCSYVFSRGTATVTLTATNPDGKSANSVVELTVNKNEAPSATIITPEFGVEYFSNGLTLFEGTAADGEDLPEEMTVSWTSSIDGVLPFSATPSSDGKSTGTHTLSQGEHELVFTVTDSTGRTGSDTTTIQVLEGSRPELELVSPTSGQVVNDGDIVYFEALVSDLEDDEADLIFSWESSIDGVFSTQGASSSGVSDFTYNRLSQGVHTITVYATDLDGLISRDSATLYVNSSPEAPVIHIDPDPAGSGEALSVVVDTESYDPDGDPITYSYNWYLNGVDTGLVSNPLPASATTRGDVWTVYVTPNDGYIDGAAGSDSVRIGNGPPSISSATISPTTAYTNDTLTAVPSTYSDPDGDPEDYKYQWSVNGTAVVGATDSTLAGTYFVRADVVTVEVWPWDGFDLGASVISGSRTIQNSLPTAPGVDVTPNKPEDDAELTCAVTVPSVDDDGDTITYTYAWTVSGVPSAISTETVASSYTSDGETWACIVTPNDGSASGTSGTDSVVVGDYTAPDAPVLNTPDPYRNDASVTISGTTEPFATVTLYISSSFGITTDSASANGAGSFSFSEGLVPGYSYSFYATATDAMGNVSAVSNVVGTEVCDPGDDYEDATTYGESCSNPIIDWSAINDAGSTTIEFDGNILEATDEDWYFVQSSDSVTGSYNYYRFHVEMTSGSSEYAFAVYTDGCGTASLECGSGSSTDPEGNGYTEFEAYAEDVGDGSHSIPSDYRTCSTGSVYNDCDDLSGDYYIHVFRTTTAYSCGGYSLKITNGAW